jgi:uncharacterized RDD family membrane protein YckC
MDKKNEGEFEPKDLSAAARRPGYPVAGFWIRAAAFAMDVILLNFFAYLLIFVFREQLFQLGYYCGFLGVFINLGYFAFFNGPLGKGKTPGKYFLNLTVVRWSGEPLDLQQGVIRTVVQLNFLLVLHFFIPLFIRDVTSIEQLFTINVLRILVFAFLVANAVLVATHPFKCGFHDLAVRSYVARDPQRLEIAAVLASEGESIKRWQRSAFQSAGIAFIVVLVLFTFQASRSLLSAEARRQFEIHNALKARFQIEGFEFVGVRLLSQAEKAKRQQQTRTTPPAATPPATTPAADVTSGTLSAENRGDVVLVYVRYGRIIPQQMEENPAIKSVLARAGQWAEEELPERLRENNQTFQSLNVQLAFHEVINLNTYFYAYDSLAYEVSQNLESAAK